MTPLRKAGKTIGWLVLTIGLLLSAGSAGLSFSSRKALERYDSGGGKFLRSFSKPDEGFYTYLRVLRVLTLILRPMGLVILAAGAAIVIKPDLVEPWLERRPPGV